MDIKDCTNPHEILDRVSSVRMRREDKEAWVTALMSGEYKQGTGVLRTSEDEFCCWGVLCNIKDSSRWELLDVGLYRYVSNHMLPSNYLLNNWMMSLSNKDLLYFRGGLASCNDGSLPGCEGHSFVEIGRWIDENVATY